MKRRYRTGFTPQDGNTQQAPWSTSHGLSVSSNKQMDPFPPPHKRHCSKHTWANAKPPPWPLWRNDGQPTCTPHPATQWQPSHHNHQFQNPSSTHAWRPAAMTMILPTRPLTPRPRPRPRRAPSSSASSPSNTAVPANTTPGWPHPCTPEEKLDHFFDDIRKNAAVDLMQLFIGLFIGLVVHCL